MHNRSNIHVTSTNNEKELVERIGEHLYEGGMDGDMNSEEFGEEGLKGNLGEGIHQHTQSMQLPSNGLF
jgi:hypothetical protein